MSTFLVEYGDPLLVVVGTIVAGLVGYFSARLGIQARIHALSERLVALETEQNKSTTVRLDRLDSTLKALASEFEQRVDKIETDT